MKKMIPANETRFWVILAIIMLIASIPCSVWAMVEPAAGTLGRDLYDVAVTQGIQGPIGFVGGIFAIVVGAVFLIRQNFMAAGPCILGGAALAKAQTLVTSLGMIC